MLVVWVIDSNTVHNQWPQLIFWLNDVQKSTYGEFILIDIVVFVCVVCVAAR